jgi:hypothetical protein
MKEAGLGEAELVGDTMFNSSAVTKGALFRAKRVAGGKRMAIEEGLNKYQEFFEEAYADGAINRKMKHLIALGASLGAGCEP